MTFYWRVISISVVALLAAGQTRSCFALTYAANVDESEWKVESSVHACKLSHTIPGFGSGVFERRAGESTSFYLRNNQSIWGSGKAEIHSLSPAWQTISAVRELGEVQVVRRERALSVDEAHSLDMIDALRQGMLIAFTRPAWYGQAAAVEVDLSPVNFQKAYESYHTCLASLLPVNFGQIERSSIHFDGTGHELSDAARQELDHIVAYLKADQQIQNIYIDGHTDNVGNREDNLELSRQRAELVSNYLVAAGIDPSLITTRFHGGRYPIARNSTAEGRQKNRRVTLRLERKASGASHAGEPDSRNVVF